MLLAVPFSAVGAIWFLYLLGYNMSIGVWVGLIALLGVDAETGVFMLLYLDLAYEQAKKEGRLRTLADLQSAIHYGAVQRLRPKFMTVATTFLGLVPIMWSVGAGADTMKRIAAPMIGGIFTSFLLELLVYPGIYQIWKWHFEMKRGRQTVPCCNGAQLSQDSADKPARREHCRFGRASVPASHCSKICESLGSRGRSPSRIRLLRQSLRRRLPGKARLKPAHTAEAVVAVAVGRVVVAAVGDAAEEGVRRPNRRRAPHGRLKGPAGPRVSFCVAPAWLYQSL